MTFETVATETPARSATSRMVTLGLGCTASDYLCKTLSTTIDRPCAVAHTHCPSAPASTRDPQEWTVMRGIQKSRLVAVLATAALALGACSGGGSPNANATGPVTL